MANEAFVRSAGEGEQFPAGPFRIVTRVSGAESGGAFELYELALGIASVDYHVHRTMDETIVVLAGQIEFQVAGAVFSRPPGSVAFIPRGVHHGFRNAGPGEARVLLHFNPARSQDAYFRELVRLFAAPELDVTELHAVQARFDQDLIPGGP